MTTDLVPGTVDLTDALAAVEAAYAQLDATDGADERSLKRLHQCAEELAKAAAQYGHRPGAIRLNEPWNLPERLRHRYLAADHGARWIMRHCR